MQTQNSTAKPNKLQVQQWIFQHSGTDLTHQEFRVLAVMMSYSRANLANAYPGQARIMEAIGCKDRKRIADLLKSLTAKGYLEKSSDHHYGSGQNRAQNYRVTVPKWIMAKVLDTDEDSPIVDNHLAPVAHPEGGDGVMSTPGVGVVSTPGEGVVSTPVTGDVSSDVTREENTYTVNADASPMSVQSKDAKDGKVVQLSPTRMLHHEARKMILTKMQSLSTVDDACELLDLLEEHYNEDVAGYAENKWTFRDCADEYEAATQLNTLVYCAANEMGQECLTPENPQVAA